MKLILCLHPFPLQCHLTSKHNKDIYWLTFVCLALCQALGFFLKTFPHLTSKAQNSKWSHLETIAHQLSSHLEIRNRVAFFFFFLREGTKWQDGRMIKSTGPVLSGVRIFQIKFLLKYFHKLCDIGMQYNISLPYFLHQQSRNNYNLCTKELLWGINEIISHKVLWTEPSSLKVLNKY